MEITERELELFALSNKGFVLDGRLSAMADAALFTEKAAKLLVCAKLPPRSTSASAPERKNMSVYALFKHTGWPKSREVSAEEVEQRDAAAAETVASGEDRAVEDTGFQLPYAPLASPEEIHRRLKGEDSCAEPCPPICAATLNFPTRGPHKSKVQYMKAQCAPLAGKWVRAVVVPKKYSFEAPAAGKRKHAVRRSGIRLELIHIQALYAAQ